VSSRVSKDRFRFSPGSCQARACIERTFTNESCQSLVSSRSNDDRSRSLARTTVFFYFFWSFFLDPSLLTFVYFPFSHLRFLVSVGRSQPKEGSLARALASPRVVLPAQPRIHDCCHTPSLKCSTLPFVLVSFISFSTLVFSCHDSSVPPSRSLQHKFQPSILRQVVPNISHLLFANLHHLSTAPLTYFPRPRQGWPNPSYTPRCCL
jgi:hypothetical protein